MEKHALRYSILLPAFRARFLKVCLESMLRQTEPDFELIVVDDASPEDLESIVRSFPDPRIRYFRNAVGCGAEHLVDNWNICLGYARGEFVLNMGDDDILEPRCLEAFGELIARHPDKDVYHMRASFIDENGTVFRVLEERPETETLAEMVLARWKGRPQMIGDYLFRRQPLVEAGGYYDLPYAWCSDDITVFRAAREKGIVNSNEPLFLFRKSRYSISGNALNTEGKLRATLLSEAWYRSVFGLRAPSVERRYYRRQRRYFLSCDASHPLSWWFRNRKSFGLGGIDILSAALKKILHRR
jgi:glycosyltransferase involved in cell wall biosynthesis